MKKDKEHSTCYKVTKNGEITYDGFTAKYSVWNESYSEVICTTGSEIEATAFLKSYCISLRLGVEHNEEG